MGDQNERDPRNASHGVRKIKAGGPFIERPPFLAIDNSDYRTCIQSYLHEFLVRDMRLLLLHPY